MRSNTCRIVLLTSLVWVIFDFVLIARYSDCIGKDGWRCKRSGEYDVEVGVILTILMYYRYKTVVATHTVYGLLCVLAERRQRKFVSHEPSTLLLLLTTDVELCTTVLLGSYKIIHCQWLLKLYESKK